MSSTKNYIESNFLKGIKPIEDALKNSNAMVAGGIFTSLYTGKDVNDVDVYFRSMKDASVFLESINDECYGARIICITDKALTISFIRGMPMVQVIYSVEADNLQDIFKAFDFTINMAGYDFKTQQFEYHEDFFTDIAARRLAFNKDTLYPIISALRIDKYKERGYYISRKEFVRIMLRIASLNITSHEELSKAIGGMYGNIIKLEVDESKPFDIFEVMEDISKQLTENSEYSLLPKPELQPMTVCGLDEVYPVLSGEETFNGGWIQPKDSTVATYLDEHGMKNRVLGIIPKIFAPQFEVKPEKKEIPDTMVVYKYVKKTDKNNVFKSFYDPNFEYKLHDPVSTERKEGLFFSFGQNLSDAVYSARQDRVILACVVRKEDWIINNQFKKCVPLMVIDDISSVPSNVSPFTDEIDYEKLLKPSISSEVKTDKSKEQRFAGDIPWLPCKL